MWYNGRRYNRHRRGQRAYPSSATSSATGQLRLKNKAGESLPYFLLSWSKKQLEKNHLAFNGPLSGFCILPEKAAGNLSRSLGGLPESLRIDRRA
jgi:hypothetical protein